MTGFKVSPTRVASVALFLATAVWGLTFPLIKNAVTLLPPLSFVAIRFLLASVVLGTFALFKGKARITLDEFGAGSILGLFLFLACASQTIGLQFTSSSKAAFITGLAVVIVPFIVLLSKRGDQFAHGKIKWNNWLGVVFSVIGLWFLSSASVRGINKGDLLVLFCSGACAFHIFFVSRYSARFDAIKLTCIQVSVCAVLSTLAALSLEPSHLLNLPALLLKTKVIMAILFCALFATAGAYFVQAVFQKHSTPVKAALIFTCEPVFAALFAYLIAGETMQGGQWAGAAILFLGMLCSELGEFISL